MLQMGSMTPMFQKEIYIYDTSKLQLKIVLMTKNSQSWHRKSKLSISCHWTALRGNFQKLKWIKQAPVPKRTYEWGKMRSLNSLENE